MGAWGAGSFENDDAGDWIYELEEASDYSLVQSTLEAIVNGGDYPEAPTCSEAVAAAEIVAEAIGRGSDALPDEAREWLAGREEPGTDLVELARSAVAIVTERGELRGLWDESDAAEDWLRVMADLAGRLA